ncbi:MAG: hypothetical protein ABIJ08_01980, partial [Nanoarchaeota archaeon]
SRFRMEMLGIMFFGMGMQKAFTGLLQPAMQMVGIFDLMNQTLGILFLPTALWILDNIMLPMMDWFTNMSPEMQGVIGAFTVLGALLGSFLAIGGTMVLGISSITQALISFGVSAAAIQSFFTGLGAILGAAFLPVTAAIIAAIFLWTTNFGGFRDFLKANFSIALKGITDTFKNASNLIMGIFGLLTAALSGDWDLAWKLMVNVFKNYIMMVVNILTTAISVMVNSIIWLINTLKDNVMNGVNFALTALQKVGIGGGAIDVGNIGNIQRSSVDNLIGGIGSKLDSFLGTGAGGNNNMNVNVNVNAPKDFDVIARTE